MIWNGKNIMERDEEGGGFLVWSVAHRVFGFSVAFASFRVSQIAGHNFLLCRAQGKREGQDVGWWLPLVELALGPE